jgi:hypothetical protein
VMTRNPHMPAIQKTTFANFMAPSRVRLSYGM